MKRWAIWQLEHECLYRARNLNILVFFKHFLTCSSSSIPSLLSEEFGRSAFWKIPVQSHPQINPQNQLILWHVKRNLRKLKLGKRPSLEQPRLPVALLPPWTLSSGSWSVVIFAECWLAQRAAETFAVHDLAHQCPSLWRGPPGCLGLFSCPHSAVRNTDSSRHVSLPGTAQGIYSRLISPALLNSVSYQHSAFSSHKDCPEKPTKLGREHNPLRILRHKTKGQRRTCCWRPDRARQSSMGSDRSMLTVSPAHRAQCHSCLEQCAHLCWCRPKAKSRGDISVFLTAFHTRAEMQLHMETLFWRWVLWTGVIGNK